MLRYTVGVISDTQKAGKNLRCILLSYFVKTEPTIKASKVVSTSYHHLAKRRVGVKEECVQDTEMHTCHNASHQTCHRQESV
jgi:hypothetical protein